MLVALVRHIQMIHHTPGSSSTLTVDSDPRALETFERDKVFTRYATNIYFASMQLLETQRADAMEIDQDNIIYSWLTDDYEVH